MTEPLVSILVPLYNRHSLFNRSLWNLFGQTYRDYEIIVVDDGSDASFEFEYLDGAKAPPFRFQRIRPPGSRDRGPNMAWWEAWRMAEGDFIICTHPEILVPRNAIELMLRYHIPFNRSVPTQYTISGWRQQHRIDRVDWKKNMEALKHLPDFWDEVGRWNYTNRQATEYTHHFSFTGQTREEWERYGFIPETSEPNMDDSWMREQEVAAGFPPTHLPMIEVYHQWHLPLPHQAPWRDGGLGGVKAKRFIEADRVLAKEWLPDDRQWAAT